MNKEKVEMDKQLIELRREYEKHKKLADESRKVMEKKYPEVFKEEEE